MRRKIKSPVNFNMGSSSLLLIFVVLSLVSFAVLSLSTALSDKNLSEKTLAKNVAYYNACNKVYEELSRLDKTYKSNYDSAPDENAYMAACGETTKIQVPVSEYHNLEVVVNTLYPVESGDSFYSISSWKVIYSEEPVIDFSVDVIK